VQRKRKVALPGELVERCLGAFIQAGNIDLSLDELAKSAGSSKRMLVHYFGHRENLEEKAMSLLEDRLRQQFSPESFPENISPQEVVAALWEQTTSPASRGVLLLVMGISRRAWSGSARARSFYEEQQRLWVDLLTKYFHAREVVEEILQLFQGAVLAYLITGDPEPGRRSLARIAAKKQNG
jgi:AcrR family transcriptional regulator